MSNLDLSELFNYYGSDKDKNGYTSLYHTLFNNLKNQKSEIRNLRNRDWNFNSKC